MPAPPKHSGWSRGEFARIARDVEQLTGIVFPANRIPSAESGMARAMSKLRIGDPVSLEIAVSRPGPARDALMAELTIGESYFFREPAQLRFLADELLPEWNEAWPSGKGVRIWSAGCAAGQEPYSIAMLLREKKWKRPHRIIGTDLSESRLVLARRAEYSKWSLRTMSADRIRQWFQPAGSGYNLDPTVAQDVEFAAMNLSAPFPDFVAQQDAIFCRNVLIYFDIATIVQMAERLLAALSPNGWLFLGASDPHIADLTPCEAVVLPGATAYRRCNEGVSGYGLRHAALTLIEPLDIPVDELANSDAYDDVVEGVYTVNSPSIEPWHSHSEKMEPDAIGTPAISSADVSVHEIRELANQGRLVEAGRVLAGSLEKYPANAELHLLESVLCAEADRWVDAERAARRALYLDRSLTLAHVALGDALARKGSTHMAQRSFENAAALITALESRGAPADPDGVPLARLLHIVRAHLSALEAGRLNHADRPRSAS